MSAADDVVAEQGSEVDSEFRDSNMPAGYEQLRVLKEAVEFLPIRVEEVVLRSDTAGYQRELLKCCAKGKNERRTVACQSRTGNVCHSTHGVSREPHR